MYVNHANAEPATFPGNTEAFWVWLGHGLVAAGSQDPGNSDTSHLEITPSPGFKAPKSPDCKLSPTVRRKRFPQVLTPFS